MKIVTTKKSTSTSGYAIVSIVMLMGILMIVGSAVLVSASSNFSIANKLFYDRLAQNAARSGVDWAKYMVSTNQATCDTSGGDVLAGEQTLTQTNQYRVTFEIERDGECTFQTLGIKSTGKVYVPEDGTKVRSERITVTTLTRSGSGVVSGSTSGGKAFKGIPYGTKIYSVYRDVMPSTNSTNVGCHDRNINDDCAGFPGRISSGAGCLLTDDGVGGVNDAFNNEGGACPNDLLTSSITEVYFDFDPETGNSINYPGTDPRIFFVAHKIKTPFNTSTVGLGCVNVVNHTSCGYTELGVLPPANVGDGPSSMADGLTYSNHKLFFLGGNRQVYCLDLGLLDTGYALGPGCRVGVVRNNPAPNTYSEVVQPFPAKYPGVGDVEANNLPEDFYPSQHGCFGTCSNYGPYITSSSYEFGTDIFGQPASQIYFVMNYVTNSSAHYSAGYTNCGYVWVPQWIPVWVPTGWGTGYWSGYWSGYWEWQCQWVEQYKQAKYGVRVACFDTATMQACNTQTNGTPDPTKFQFGQMQFMLPGTSAFDLLTTSVWAAGGKPFIKRASNLSVNGVCFTAHTDIINSQLLADFSNDGQYNGNGPGTQANHLIYCLNTTNESVSAPPDFDGAIPGAYYTLFDHVETDNARRIYMPWGYAQAVLPSPSLGANSGATCYDWQTQSRCANFGPAASSGTEFRNFVQWRNIDSHYQSGNSCGLPKNGTLDGCDGNVANYTIGYDPYTGCLIGAGDIGILFSFNPVKDNPPPGTTVTPGASPCTLNGALGGSILL